MSDRAKACVDINALYHNITVIKQLAPRSNVLAMVKSNAYGHGIAVMGQVMNNVEGFGVACLDEAIQLRENGVLSPIVIMSGVFTHEDLKLVSYYNLAIVIHDYFQIKLLKSYKVEKPITIWLKIDTGMHRLGFEPNQFKEAYNFLANSEKINRPFVIMTHLADADDVNKTTTPQQVAIFNQFTQALPGPKSIANSAGIIAWPDTIAQWNRPGISLYGISPMLGKTGLDHHLKPVMTLKSKIIAIHDLKKGDAIGYGGTWTCSEDMRVGVVGIGYGDGYPRHAKNGTPTLIHGKICPLVGRVSMDLITVDLAPSMQTEVGDDVILWGNGLPAEVVAKYSDTIAYELVCNVSQRVVFIYGEQGNL